MYHISERIYFIRPTIIYFPIKKASAGGPRVSRKSFHLSTQFRQSDLAYQRLINCPVNCCGARRRELPTIGRILWRKDRNLVNSFSVEGDQLRWEFQVVSGLNEDIKAAEKGSAHKQEFK